MFQIYGFQLSSQNAAVSVPTSPTPGTDPSGYIMPGLGDMAGLTQLQSQMATQSAQMLSQIQQLLTSSQPGAISLPQQPSWGLGTINVPNYCFPPMPPSPWQQQLPWNGGGCPPPPPHHQPITWPHHCGGHHTEPHHDGAPPTRVCSGDLAACSPRTRAFIESALSKQGKPYVFGATGPKAYDCSGLVYRSLRDVGVQGPRMAARYMQADLKDHAVSKEDLKPGDLLFFWSPNDRGIPYPKASHVEVYLGNGKSMGTDNPSEGARVEAVNWKTFVGGARVPELQA